MLWYVCLAILSSVSFSLPTVHVLTTTTNSPEIDLNFIAHMLENNFGLQKAMHGNILSKGCLFWYDSNLYLPKTKCEFLQSKPTNYIFVCRFNENNTKMDTRSFYCAVDKNIDFISLYYNHYTKN